MPFSTAYFKSQTKDYIVSNFDVSSRILDVGAGAGAYYDMLNPLGYKHIDCVEAFADYIDNYELHKKYSTVYNEDVTKLNIDFNKYDLIIFGDVLEHIDKDAAKKLLDKITTNVIIGVPFLSPQDESFNNKFEIHLQEDLTFINFFERFDNFKPLCLRWDYGIFINGDTGTIFVETDERPIDDSYTEYIKANFSNCKIKNIYESEEVVSDANTTIVTGLWDINRHNRSFDHYIESFARFLTIDKPMYIYVPEDLEDFIWQYRDASNTTVHIFNLSDIEKIYEPFWDRTQAIRTSDEWKYQTGEQGWLTDSPQMRLEYYNPIVQSKMFLLHTASIINPHNTDYFYWLDAGITNTVPEGHLRDEHVLDKLHEYTTEDEFLFISFPYDANTEIHGFTYPDINNYAGEDVKYVCRGGLFGAHKKAIDSANAEYYAMLDRTLSDGYMGTEESIFSIMAHKDPHTYRRFEIEYNGLIVTATQGIIDGTAKLAEIDGDLVRKRFQTKKVVPNNITQHLKTNLYMLTFNMPEQLIHTINTMNQTEGLMSHPTKYIFDNSTNEKAAAANKVIADQHGFEYMHLGSNLGICGGRQKVAEHFHESDADYYLFFEDDMTFNTTEQKGEVCRNGFRKYVDNIYEIIHKIIYVEDFDFLKMSFTEVYFDNDRQCSWYNVPQDVREKYWPHYNKLPEQGLDPNCPKTEFDVMNTIDGVAYMSGDVYYSNWPLLVSRDGNKKMFIDTTWDHPFEQTWMSHMFQLTKEGKLFPAILLASPIWHDRIKYYDASERVES